MKVRKQDADGDMVFGGSQAAFFVNKPDGVAQVVNTRLRLQTGTWFLDRSQGIDYRTKVLGKYTGDTRDIAIRTRILGSPGVTGIAAYGSQLNRDTRGFRAEATIDTLYGQAKIVEAR